MQKWLNDYMYINCCMAFQRQISSICLYFNVVTLNWDNALPWLLTMIHACILLQASENSNAILIGVTNGTGRSSLTRLASHMARCKLYAPEMTRDPEENRLRLRHQIKKASKTAGLIARQAVLLVKDSIGRNACRTSAV